jgi:hypothetical protein
MKIELSKEEVAQVKMLLKNQIKILKSMPDNTGELKKAIRCSEKIYSKL